MRTHRRLHAALLRERLSILRLCRVTDQKQADEADTVDIEVDTEDVVEEDVKSQEPTEPDLSSGRPPHKIRMPSKAEIHKAVESVRTESLEVEAVTRNAAQVVKVEDVD